MSKITNLISASGVVKLNLYKKILFGVESFCASEFLVQMIFDSKLLSPGPRNYFDASNISLKKLEIDQNC